MQSDNLVKYFEENNIGVEEAVNQMIEIIAWVIQTSAYREQTQADIVKGIEMCVKLHDDGVPCSVYNEASNEVL